MKADGRYLHLGKDFWAHIRTISEGCGYTEKAPKMEAQANRVKVPSVEEIKNALAVRGLDYTHLVDNDNILTELGQLITSYYGFRADVLNQTVENRLMTVDKARTIFEELKTTLHPKCPLPFNKQKGEKKAPAYFTGIINMLIDANLGGFPCDYNPRKLTTVVRNLRPLRTFARRIDGAFPSTVNPIAVWEIKEYYYTTTFGSRVADAIYETLLDGYELQELFEHEKLKVKHYLMIDDHYTWWECGKSYLCRLMDILHMGYVDEILFGREVVERLPGIVAEWREAVINHDGITSGPGINP